MQKATENALNLVKTARKIVKSAQKSVKIHHEPSKISQTPVESNSRQNTPKVFEKVYSSYRKSTAATENL